MGNINNMGPYLAERLVYFKKGLDEVDTISNDIQPALREGKVVISGLEFKIRTLDKDFLVDVYPFYKETWNSFEMFLNQLEDLNFWSSDKKLVDLLACKKNFSYFVNNRKEKIIIDKNFAFNKLRITGTFTNYNKEESYKYILNSIVKPLILYEGFLKNK